MGIRDRPISPRSPWQNPYVERLIGTVRRECLDLVLDLQRGAPAANSLFVCGVLQSNLQSFLGRLPRRAE